MKASSASSAPTTAETVPPSASAPSRASPRSPIADGFALSGVSSPPDPATHAYRKDLADTTLAGTVIASHYAEPLARRIIADTELMQAPSPDSERLGKVSAGDHFRMLDSALGWAWGYAADGRVGYVAAEALGT